MTFTPGDRVNTPLGPATVLTQRMEPPTYRHAAAVSVRLDSRQTDPRYSGTVFAAADVEPLERCTYTEHDTSGRRPCVRRCTRLAGHPEIGHAAGHALSAWSLE